MHFLVQFVEFIINDTLYYENMLNSPICFCSRMQEVKGLVMNKELPKIKEQTLTVYFRPDIKKHVFFFVKSKNIIRHSIIPVFIEQKLEILCNSGRINSSGIEQKDMV